MCFALSVTARADAGDGFTPGSAFLVAPDSAQLTWVIGAMEGIMIASGMSCPALVTYGEAVVGIRHAIERDPKNDKTPFVLAVTRYMRDRGCRIPEQPKK